MRPILYFGIVVELTVTFPFIQVETQLIFVAYDLLHVYLLAAPHTYRLYDTFFCRPQRVMHSILSCRILLHVREKDRAMQVMSTMRHYSIIAVCVCCVALQIM